MRLLGHLGSLLGAAKPGYLAFFDLNHNFSTAQGRRLATRVINSALTDIERYIQDFWPTCIFFLTMVTHLLYSIVGLY